MTPEIGRLHVLTDEVLQSRYSHEELARLATAGGADTIQLREKRQKSTADMMRVANAMAIDCASAGALFVVDDFADVAAATNAPAVHLGRNDLSTAVARRILGDEAIIGGTANSLEEAMRVAAGPVDYLGVGPIFGTQSKANPAPDMGLDTLRLIVDACSIPIIAIGNINPDQVADVLATGAHGIAVLSGIVCQPDPTEAARRYRTIIDNTLNSGEGRA